MAQRAIEVDRVAKLDSGRVAILRSKWYPEYVDVLTACCKRTLLQLGVVQVDTHELPGTLEMPYAASALLKRRPDLDALVVLGVVVEGATKHFEMIVDAVGPQLTRLAVDFDVPILNEILAVRDVAHAAERSNDDGFNKGIEAAVAAVEIIRWRRGLERE